MQLIVRELVVPLTSGKAAAGVKKEQRPLRLTVDESRIEMLFEQVTPVL